jgi:hypothetical protein
LRLEQELARLLEEKVPRRLVAETIGLAVIDGVDRAVGLDVLAESKAHHALAAELTVGGNGRSHAQGEHGAGKSAEKRHSRHDHFLLRRLVGAVGLEPTTR